MRGLAVRRHHAQRVKERARRLARIWGATHPMWRTLADDPRWVGHMASTHCRPCSCEMCRRERYGKRDRQW